jgi:hypothetical protein
MLLSHNALPRQGHLETVFDIFAAAAIVFDDIIPFIQENQFKKVD